MQTWSGPNVRATQSPTRKVATYTLLLFAVAGLIAGFAFGGFTHLGASNTPNNSNTVIKNTPTPQTATAVTATPTTQPVVPLGIPKFEPFPDTIENVANSPVYSMGIQVVDKRNKALHGSNITCKAWLVQQIPDKQKLSIDAKALKSVTNLSQPITGTVNNQPFTEVGGLVFDTTTPQTDTCNDDGHKTWKYTLAPTLTPGSYDIVILADWKGIHWNWSWVHITVK